MPCTAGTLTWPWPVDTEIVTVEPFGTCVPSSGSCATTIPFGFGESTVFAVRLQALRRRAAAPPRRRCCRRASAPSPARVPTRRRPSPCAPSSSSAPACGAWSTTVPGAAVPARRIVSSVKPLDAARSCRLDQGQPDQRRHVLAAVVPLEQPEDEEEDRGSEEEHRRAPRATTDTAVRSARAARPRRRRRGARPAGRQASDRRRARQAAEAAAQSLAQLPIRATPSGNPIGTAGFEPRPPRPKRALYQAELRPVRLKCTGRGYSDSISARSSPSFSRRRSSRSPRSIRPSRSRTSDASSSGLNGFVT